MISLSSTEATTFAREILEEHVDGGVGRHLGVKQDGNTMVYRFAADVPGYPGWEWMIVLAQVPGSERITVNEWALLPGEGALKIPKWVPYEDRIQPGDLQPGDVLPPKRDDVRLTSEGELSRKGRQEALNAWREDYGPRSEMASLAEFKCRSCAFFQPTPTIGKEWGVCFNRLAQDGHVVMNSFGCGAHSATKPVPLT